MERVAMVDTIGKYTALVVGILAATYLFVYGDPAKVGAWMPIIAALPGTLALFQLRAIHTAVNSGNSEALRVSSDAAFARGQLSGAQLTDAGGVNRP